jgi:CotH kinase protein
MSNTTRNVAAVLVSIALAGASVNAKSAEQAEPGTKESLRMEVGAGARLALIRKQYPRYAYSKSHNSSQIFDQGKLQRYDLWLEDSSLAAIDAEPAAEKYVEGALLHDGKLVPAVGIRYKGRRGAFYGCLNGPDPFVPSGAKSCSKLSLKVKIDWNGPDDMFYGMKKLNFQSNNLDPTMMRERLGYWLFNQFGVTASRAVHAKLYVNGEYAGVFTLTEEVDDTFAKRNFAGGRGNLYKEVWPVDDQGKRTPDAALVAALRSNAKKAQVGNYVEFASAVEALERTQNRNRTDAMVRQWFDVDGMMRYIVVDRSILADDGIFHWWCFDGKTCYSQNYYWYQDTKSKKVRLIPWDLDLAFENLGEPKNPVTPVGKWNEVNNDCKPFPSGAYSMIQRSAACDKLMHAFTIYEKEYAELKAQFERKYYNPENIGKLLDQWSAQIEPAVAEASAKHKDQATVDSWKKAVAKLKGDILAGMH